MLKPIKYIVREKIPRRGGNTESFEDMVRIGLCSIMASVIIFMVVNDDKNQDIIKTLPFCPPLYIACGFILLREFE